MKHVQNKKTVMTHVVRIELRILSYYLAQCKVNYVAITYVD